MITMLFYLTIFVTILVMIMAVANPKFFFGFVNPTPKPMKTKQDELEAAIKEKTKNLKIYYESMDAAAKLTSQRHDLFLAVEKEVTKLNALVHESLKNGEEEKAKIYTEQLISKEKEATALKSKRDESHKRFEIFSAKASHTQDEINDAQLEAEELKIEINLAKNQALVDDADLKNALQEKRSELQKHQAAVAAANVAEDPNDKFIQAAKEKNVSDRLNQIRNSI